MYSLDTLVEVEHYWYDLWEICINTPLGESSSLSGQEITLEVQTDMINMAVLFWYLVKSHDTVH